MIAIRTVAALTALALIAAIAGSVFTVAHTVSHITRPRDRGER